MSFKKNKSNTGELADTKSLNGITKDIERLRGKYTSDFPVRRGMFCAKPKEKP